MDKNINETINRYFDIPSNDVKIEDDEETIMFKIFGRIVQRKRSYLRISQAELSDRIGLTRTSITNIEVGKQKLPLIKMLKLFLILDESFETFIQLVQKEIGL